MKTRMVLVAAAILVFAVAGFGQGFCAFLYDADHQLRASSPDACEGGAPLPDGTVVQIYWDANNNGPDAADVQPTVGQNTGDVNYNTFILNGDAQGIGTGYFAVDAFFCSIGGMPNPAHYYLVIRCDDGSIHYTSQVFSPVVGPQEFSITEWACTPCTTVPPCEPTLRVDFGRFPVPAYACADLCPGTVTALYVCGVADPTKPPIVSIVSGCNPLETNCDRQCPPAQFVYDPLAWAFDPATGCWTNVVIGGSEGCVCITLEGFLAVGYNNDFAAQAMDNSVKLTWSTSSENGVVRYDIIRGSDKVGEVPAANAAHTYNYVDESAVNGTTYTYTLRAINNDGTVSELGTVPGTASFGAAVVTEYALHQNFPNPFNPSTEITFDVVQKNLVTLKVYNAAGQVVGTVANGEFEAGRHIVSFNAGNLPSGLYFYTVKIGNEFSATKKMLLVK